MRSFKFLLQGLSNRVITKGIFTKTSATRKYLSSSSALCSYKDFGILCDIDGVLTRGRTVLNAAVNALDLLCDENGQWKAPILFLTNAGNQLKKTKAEEISDLFKKKISPLEIVMSHTPLRQFSEYFDKHIAICGLGPIKDIAQNLGFKHTSTIEEISDAYPLLNACKLKENMPSGPRVTKKLDKIEAIILFGEPERWEFNLQLLLDLLIHDGDLSKSLEDCNGNKTHLPVFACSSDLVWAGETAAPRIAHGSFLVCLESLFSRISGQQLHYTALIGKPSPVTYTFAFSQLNAISAKNFGGAEPLKRVYCIGDNPDVDIYGANLYNLCLKTLSGEAFRQVNERIHSLIQDEHPFLSSTPFRVPNLQREELFHTLIESSAAMPNILQRLSMSPRPVEPSLCDFYSILVLTGVYQEHQQLHPKWPRANSAGCDDSHHGLPHLPDLAVPNFVARDVGEAFKYILSLEGCLESKEMVEATRCCPYFDEGNSSSS